MQNSPIGWCGGKKRLRERIIARFPAHAIYVEVFAGAAWVLFGKDPKTSQVEAVNDLNGELTNFYRCVREKPLELIEKLRFRLLSAEDFRCYVSGAKAGSEVKRAALFFWALRLAYASRANNRATFGYRFKGRWQGFRSDLIEPTIKAAHARLQNVLVFNEDFEALINRCDRDETFFYCDPPYYGTSGLYAHEFTVEDHERLAATLGALRANSC